MKKSGPYLPSQFLIEIAGGLKATSISTGIKLLIVYVLIGRLYQVWWKILNFVSSVLLYTSHHF